METVICKNRTSKNILGMHFLDQKKGIVASCKVFVVMHIKQRAKIRGFRDYTEARLHYRHI